MKATLSRSNKKFILAGKTDGVWHYSSRTRKIHYPNSNHGLNPIYWTPNREDAMYETVEVAELFEMVWKDCGQNFEDFKLIDVSELYS